MSKYTKYFKWTKHPETGHYHNALWFEKNGSLTVKFNDNKEFSADSVDSKTYEWLSEVPSDETLDISSGQDEPIDQVIEDLKESIDIVHEHTYTIPVEWGYHSYKYGEINKFKKVTKLRCECGEEIER